MIKANIKIRVTKDNVPELVASLKKLTQLDVLVGVPADNTARSGIDSKRGPINNAELAYIHTYGAPSVNIPARPFLVPGIKSAKTKINERLFAAGQAALNANFAAMESAFRAAGEIGAGAARKIIQAGIPPPLKPGSIRSRKYSRQTQSTRKGEREYLRRLSKGESENELFSAGLITPLINTGQLLKSITYVIRRRSGRK